MLNLREEMFQDVAFDKQRKTHHKVTVVGIGAVGMATAFSILTQVNFYCLKFPITWMTNFKFLLNSMCQVMLLSSMSLRINWRENWWICSMDLTFWGMPKFPQVLTYQHLKAHNWLLSLLVFVKRKANHVWIWFKETLISWKTWSPNLLSLVLTHHSWLSLILAIFWHVRKIVKFVWKFFKIFLLFHRCGMEVVWLATK